MGTALHVVVRLPCLSLTSLLSVVCVTGLAGALAGCSGAAGADGTNAGGAADDALTSDSSVIDEPLVVGSTLRTTANLNLRSGAGTSHSVIDVIPDGDTVTLVTVTPTNGWYNISYAGQSGYSSGAYLTASHSNGGGSSSGNGSGGDPVTRAMTWVSADMPYCGGTNGGTDYICGGTCERTGSADHSDWNVYRSDCSGLVSYAWALAAPGLVTSQFAPFDTSASYEVNADQLQPGDALNSDPAEHMMLFASWADPSTGQANVIEEYNCGHVATAHVVTLEYTAGSSTVSIPDWSPHEYRAIRKR